MSNRNALLLVLLCTGLASCASFRAVDASAERTFNAIGSADLWPFGDDDQDQQPADDAQTQAATTSTATERQAEPSAPEPAPLVINPEPAPPPAPPPPQQARTEEPVQPIVEVRKPAAAEARAAAPDADAPSDLQRALSEQQVRATAQDQSKAIESKVVQSWLTSAQTGNPMAQVVVASLYENGSGVARNLAEAVSWYRKAAMQGYHRGEHHLGRMYHFGLGVPEDEAESGRWLRRAADQGDAQAQGLLALLYLEGRGVPQNYQQAYLWASVAATGDAQHARARDEALIGQYSEGIQRELRAETARQNQEVQQWAKDIREAAARQLPPEKLTEAQQLAASQWERLNGTTAPVIAPVSNRRAR